MTKKKSKKKTKKKIQVQTSGVEPSPVKVTPYPHAGKKIDEFEKKLDEQLEEKTQVKRGRPPKQQPEQPAFGMDCKLIADGIKLPFSLWAQTQKIPDLALSDTESIAIAKPAKDLLDYYMPNFPEIGIAWLSLSISCYTIMASRLAIIAEIKKRRKEFHHPPLKQAKENGTGQGGPLSPGIFPNATEPVEL